MSFSLAMSNQYWVPKIPVPNCTVPIEFQYPFFAFFEIGISISVRYRLDTLFYLRIPALSVLVPKFNRYNTVRYQLGTVVYPLFTFEYQHFQYQYRYQFPFLEILGTGTFFRYW
ncbi:hypothetical protein Hanom_Chr01g00087701 [Helianthus anomalus]